MQQPLNHLDLHLPIRNTFKLGFGERHAMPAPEADEPPTARSLGAIAVKARGHQGHHGLDDGLYEDGEGRITIVEAPAGKCRDPTFAVLFLCQVAAVAAVALLVGIPELASMDEPAHLVVAGDADDFLARKHDGASPWFLSRPVVA